MTHHSLLQAPDLNHRLTDVDGVRVITEYIPTVHSVSLGWWVGVGSRNEHAHQRGLAHFIEHLAFKGNDHQDAEEISRFFDRIGSSANAATTKEYTVYHTRVVDRHLEPSIETFAQMICAPAFQQRDVDAERDVVLEEIAMYDDTPSDVVHELADALVFHNHELRYPIIGTPDSITGATVDDITAFHTAAYCNDNLVISAAGNCDHDEIVGWVRSHFSLIRPNTKLGTAQASLLYNPSANEQPSVTEVRGAYRRRDTEQVHICIAGRGLSFHHDDRYALTILDSILGGNPSSRLFLAVREHRGLAYSVYSFQSQYSDTGQVGVYTAVRPDRVGETLSVISAEIKRLRSDGPTKGEMTRAFDNIEGRMLLALESTSTRSNRLGSSLLCGIPIEAPATTLQRYREVTAADIQRLAAELFDPAQLSCAVVAEDPLAAAAAVTHSFGIEFSDAGVPEIA